MRAGRNVMAVTIRDFLFIQEYRVWKRRCGCMGSRYSSLRPVHDFQFLNTDELFYVVGNNGHIVCQSSSRN